jgi:putative hydrolase of the HAD superfamily
MPLIFDLDDTLYSEKTYVFGGLRSVAELGKSLYGWNTRTSFEFMANFLETHGRGLIFDAWLTHNNAYSKSLVKLCVRTYRSHIPKIALYPSARRMLSHYLKKQPLYLVTDGNKIVQARKIEALQIAHLFKRIFITHRYGIKYAKPSLHCFDIIRRHENCDWSNLIYVADNPAKDFVNLKTAGARTIRVLTGSYAGVVARPKFDAEFKVQSLRHLDNVLSKL